MAAAVLVGAVWRPARWLLVLGRLVGFGLLVVWALVMKLGMILFAVGDPGLLGAMLFVASMFCLFDVPRRGGAPLGD